LLSWFQGSNGYRVCNRLIGIEFSEPGASIIEPLLPMWMAYWLLNWLAGKSDFKATYLRLFRMGGFHMEACHH